MRLRKPEPVVSLSIRSHLRSFQRLVRQRHLQAVIRDAGLHVYDRIFSPVVTVWCMVFQRLNPDHSLQAAVNNLHCGHADGLSSRKTLPLSERIQSTATTALTKARQRLPVALFHTLLAAQGQSVMKETGQTSWRGLRVLLLDGSQISLRPYDGIVKEFEVGKNQQGKTYWALMRVVASFCLHTGIVVASAVGSTRASEQALAIRLILQGMAGILYLGDRNFGIFRVVRAVRDAQTHALFRMTESRASKLAGSPACRRRYGDYAVEWFPTREDLRQKDCGHLPVSGRLIITRYTRAGFRSRRIYLFTTLTDAQAYPTEALLELYGLRWHVEVNLRYLKAQMQLHQLECKSAEMAEKEWMAGLMAYNLVRGVMFSAALKEGIATDRLSFSAARRWLLCWLREPAPDSERAWDRLLQRVARTRQPSRSKPRPAEPRAKRHKRETFPPLRGSRHRARRHLNRKAHKC